jgi:hypothetical protein
MSLSSFFSSFLPVAYADAPAETSEERDAGKEQPIPDADNAKDDASKDEPEDKDEPAEEPAAAEEEEEEPEDVRARVLAQGAALTRAPPADARAPRGVPADGQVRPAHEALPALPGEG